MTTTRPLPLALLLAAGLALGAGSLAQAAEVAKLRNGDLIPGEVVSFDDAAVVFAREAGGRLTIPWSAILPVSRYELWESTLASGDGAGRVALAEWAFAAELFVPARRELLKAKGLLGTAPEGDDVDQRSVRAKELLERVDGLLEKVDRAEADAALATMGALLEKDDPEAALDVVRRYLRVAPPGAEADRVRGHVADLLVRIERKEADAAEAEASAADRKKAARREKWIAGNLRKAADAKGKSEEHAIEAYVYLQKGNQTRARRALTRAEKGFVTARATFKKTRRVAGPGDTADLCKREMADCDRRMVDLLTRWGTLEVENKSWKRASAAVDRGLGIDPVDTTLLDLRQTIDENWIRRKLSGITNASGRESSN